MRIVQHGAWACALALVACQPGLDSAIGGGSSSSGGGSTESGDAPDPHGSDDGSTGEPPAGTSKPWAYGWPVPAEPQTEGDPVAGYDKLVNYGYLTCGIPLSMWSVAQPFMGSFAGEQPLPGRTGDNADIPYDWTAHTAPSGVKIVSQNCLQCHAGEFNGELVLGLGNAHRDFTSSQSATFNAIPVPELGFGALGELTKFLNRVQGMGDNSVMHTIGTNPAEMVAISLVSHRDVDTLAWSDEPWFQVPPVAVPSDVPPWWRAHKKNALFYNAMARGDHRGTMILATALCTDDVAEAETIVAQFADIHAFVRTLRAPKYPFPIDEDLAAAGKPIFDADCAPCHGTYAASDGDETFPNLLIPLDIVGTDPVVAEGGKLWAPELVEWYNASFYGSITRMDVDDPFMGYLAPPLDGIWATGPFLHNGSVPNLALVLDSEKRPTYWRRIDYDSTTFDEVSLGWPYVEVDAGHDVLPPDEAKYVYDTTLFGHHATGHPFGDHLSDAERTAVIEYLKTL